MVTSCPLKGAHEQNTYTQDIKWVYVGLWGNLTSRDVATHTLLEIP